TRGTTIQRLPLGQDFGEVAALTITDVDDANGTWEFSRDGRETWLALAPAPGEPVVLRRDARTFVRFLPQANFNGPASLQFRPGEGIDATLSPLFRSSLVVEPVNDPPTAFSDQLPDVVGDAPVLIPFDRLLGNDNPGPANESGHRLRVVSVES